MRDYTMLKILNIAQISQAGVRWCNRSTKVVDRSVKAGLPSSTAGMQLSSIERAAFIHSSTSTVAVLHPQNCILCGSFTSSMVVLHLLWQFYIHNNYRFTSIVIHFCYHSREEDLVVVAWELYHPLQALYFGVFKILGASGII
jgi:hypothetical protein